MLSQYFQLINLTCNEAECQTQTASSFAVTSNQSALANCKLGECIWLKH